MNQLLFRIFAGLVLMWLALASVVLVVLLVYSWHRRWDRSRTIEYTAACPSCNGAGGHWIDDDGYQDWVECYLCNGDRVIRTTTTKPILRRNKELNR